MIPASRSSTRTITSGRRGPTRICWRTWWPIFAAAHNVLATVFIQCRSEYRDSGPESMQPVGETEFVAAAAQACESGDYGGLRACAGIVGHADCLLGEAIDAVLEAHIEAGGGRFKGSATAAPTTPGSHQRLRRGHRPACTGMPRSAPVSLDCIGWG